MNKKSILITVGAIVLLAVLGGLGYYTYTQLNTKPAPSTNNNTNTTQTNTKKSDVTCGKLKADNDQTTGKSPFSPVLRAKISGNYNPASQVCKWLLNGKAYGSSFPINGECIFGGNPLTTPGNYTIQFNAVDNNTCGDEMVVSVTE